MHKGKFIIYIRGHLEEFMSKRLDRLLVVHMELEKLNKGKFFIYKNEQLEELMMDRLLAVSM